MEDCAPSIFLKSWALVASYLCFKFRIFNQSILEKYVFQVEEGPYLLQSCLCVAQDDLPLAARKMHLFFLIWQLLVPQVYKHLWWTSSTTHPLCLSWRMIPFPQHPKVAFVLIQPRGWGYGWLLNHLSIHFASHILLSLQCCVFSQFDLTFDI